MVVIAPATSRGVRGFLIHPLFTLRVNKAEVLGETLTLVAVLKDCGVKIQSFVSLHILHSKYSVLTFFFSSLCHSRCALQSNHPTDLCSLCEIDSSGWMLSCSYWSELRRVAGPGFSFTPLLFDTTQVYTVQIWSLLGFNTTLQHQAHWFLYRLKTKRIIHMPQSKCGFSSRKEEKKRKKKYSTKNRPVLVVVFCTYARAWQD